jgi:hypothetical protein
MPHTGCTSTAKSWISLKLFLVISKQVSLLIVDTDRERASLIKRGGMEGILRKHNDGKREKTIRETTMRQQVSYLVVNPKIVSHNKIHQFSYIRSLVS